MEAGQMLGDVRPRNILLNEKEYIKIPTLHSWPLEMNKYQKTMADVVTYLAPEEMAHLQSNRIESSQLTEPAEMFALGLTVLSAAALRDYECLYDSQDIKFDL
jgi:hypothetical protein